VGTPRVRLPRLAAAKRLAPGASFSVLAREPALLMRMERGIDVLARLDRPQCLQVLRTLAQRDPSAPETKLAKAKLRPS